MELFIIEKKTHENIEAKAKKKYTNIWRCSQLDLILNHPFPVNLFDEQWME